ncbi:hypothetical protein GW17_00042777 [Ensete ventricosum]|nr:hypothetical protein GW17_00042777 [Ensete ventricosum]RZS06886.1 hypothetical protein BHM03_00037641 [Ensete ventricosum]
MQRFEMAAGRRKRAPRSPSAAAAAKNDGGTFACVRADESLVGRQWRRRLKLAVGGDRPVGVAATGRDGVADESKQDLLELLCVSPSVDLCSEGTRIGEYKLPHGMVLPRHHVVLFAQPECGTVVSLSVAQVNKSLPPVERCCRLDSLDDGTLGGGNSVRRR